MKRYIALTVDAEAHPLRAIRDALDELIWGRFCGGEFGIGRLMDMADLYKIKLTVYVDYCEYLLYGESLLDVAREVIRRGHDAQIHLHTDLLTPAFCEQFRLETLPTLDLMDAKSATIVAEFFTELAMRATGRQPSAFRGGAFRFNPHVLNAFRKTGLRLSSNYYSGAKYWRRRQPHAKMFKWPNEMVELPLSTVHVRGKYQFFVFENFPVDSKPALEAFADAFAGLPGDVCVLNHLLHSWSLLSKDDSGRFSGPDEPKLVKLDVFFKYLGELDIRSMVTDEILAVATPAQLPVVPFAEVFNGPVASEPDYIVHCDTVENRSAKRCTVVSEQCEPDSLKASREDPAPAEQNRHCPICCAPDGQFTEYFRRPRARCASCGSLERHRIMISIYEDFVQHEFTFKDKDALLVSPNACELTWLRRLAKVSTADIRAQAKPDHVVDVCGMSMIPDESFDFVIANHVFAHVYDDQKAFDEVRRVLRPGGRLFLTTPLEASRHTRQVESIDEICRLWGRELYERYRIGTFRRYGVVDLLRMLQSTFYVTTYFGIDPITGCRDVVISCERDIAIEKQEVMFPPQLLFSTLALAARPLAALDRLTPQDWICFNEISIEAGNSTSVRFSFVEAGARLLPVLDCGDSVVGSLVLRGDRVSIAPNTSQLGLRMAPTGAVTLPSAMPSGVYFIDGTFPLVISRSEVLENITVVLPVLTQYCFNEFGGPNLYSHKQRRHLVSMDRPIDRRRFSDRIEGFLKWSVSDVPYKDKLSFVADTRLEKEHILANTRLLIIVGRSEYWTRTARCALDAYISRGGDVLFLSSETMYYEINSIESGRLYEFYRCGSAIDDAVPTSAVWAAPERKYPVLESIGPNPFQGGFLPGGDLDDRGYGVYRILARSSPILEACGLKAGELLHIPSVAYDGLPIRGYEADGTPILDEARLPFHRWQLLAYNFGRESPAKRIGAWFAFQRTEKGGRCVHMGSFGWTTMKGLGGEGADGPRIPRIVETVIRMLYERREIFP